MLTTLLNFQTGRQDSWEGSFHFILACKLCWIIFTVWKKTASISSVVLLIFQSTCFAVKPMIMKSRWKQDRFTWRLTHQAVLLKFSQPAERAVSRSDQFLHYSLCPSFKTAVHWINQRKWKWEKTDLSFSSQESNLCGKIASMAYLTCSLEIMR